MSNFMQWVTHGIKRGRFEMNRRTILYASVVVALLVVIAALYLMLVSQTAARGRHIEQLREELAWLKKENEQLEVDIAKASSIARLYRRAVELGFVQVEQVEYLALTAEEPAAKEPVAKEP
jgi:cell division protein FtsL